MRCEVKTYLLLASLSVFSCTDSSESEDSEDATPQTEEPAVWIEAGNGLPTGESSADTLEVTISSNKTAISYQYAFFSDDNVTCEAATYREYVPIATKLVETSLGANGVKIICIRGKDKNDKVQANPKRYTWEKVSDVVVATGEVMPLAELKIAPSSEMETIDIEVKGNDITVKYQYALISREDYDCADIDSDSSVSYSVVTPIATKLTLSAADLGNGHKTLCLRGLDKNDRVQNEASDYHWVKQPPGLHKDSEVPEADQPAIGLITSNEQKTTSTIAFVSGDNTVYGLTVKNIGTGTLKWQAKTTSDVDWLMLYEKSNDQSVEIKAGELASGEIVANTNYVVFFKLTKGKDTDYGTPYEREHEIIFVNTESGHEIKEKITLTIPKLDTSRENISLTSHSESVKVYAKNIGKAGMDIHIVGVFPTDITKDEKKDRIDKFRGLVQYKTGLETTGTNAGEHYVELKVTDAGKESCEVVEQTLFVYSNGDSKDTSDCTVDGTKSYLGGSTVWGGSANRGAIGNAKWTTSRCKRIVVNFNGLEHLDLNEDGIINILDLTFAAGHVGKPPDPMTDDYRLADVDGNGTVDKDGDLVAISNCLGKELPSNSN